MNDSPASGSWLLGRGSTCALLALVFTLGSAGARQDSGGTSAKADPAAIAKRAAESAKESEAFDRSMEEQGIVIDRQRQIIAMRGMFNYPRQPLEYLVTAPKGSHYESLVSIEARPSNVAAALISLNVQFGTSPKKKLKEKRPTEEELQAGATVYEVEPGSGGGVFIYIEWYDDRGFHRHRIEDLVFERPEGRTIPNARFLFIKPVLLQSQNPKAPAAFSPDLDGNFISCSFSSQPVLTYPKPHPYAMEGDFEIYQPNWTLVPSEKLQVTVLLCCEELDRPLIPKMAPPSSAPASAPVR